MKNLEELVKYRNIIRVNFNQQTYQLELELLHDNGYSDFLILTITDLFALSNKSSFSKNELTLTLDEAFKIIENNALIKASIIGSLKIDNLSLDKNRIKLLEKQIHNDSKYLVLTFFVSAENIEDFEIDFCIGYSKINYELD